MHVQWCFCFWQKVNCANSATRGICLTRNVASSGSFVRRFFFLFLFLLLLLATALHCIHVTKERVPCFKISSQFLFRSPWDEARLQLLSPRYRDHAGTIVYLSCLVYASYANPSVHGSLPCVIFGCESILLFTIVSFKRSR